MIGFMNLRDEQIISEAMRGAIDREFDENFLAYSKMTDEELKELRGIFTDILYSALHMCSNCRSEEDLFISYGDGDGNNTCLSNLTVYCSKCGVKG